MCLCRTCSGLLPATPIHPLWAAVGSRRVQLWKWPPCTPSPGCTEHPGICRARNWGGLINSFLQVTMLLPASDQDHPDTIKISMVLWNSECHHPALKAALLGKTSIRKAKCLKYFQNSSPSFVPALATFTHAVNHLLVSRWTRCTEHRSQ